jgi:hypothetical protein
MGILFLCIKRGEDRFLKAFFALLKGHGACSGADFWSSEILVANKWWNHAL